jgi:hypothetical protein
MEDAKRTHIKIKRLLKAAELPTWFHHFGPKKFQTWQHCLGLVVKQVYQLSYRRAVKFLDEYYNIKMNFSTLQKAAKRLPRNFWQSLLSATIDVDEIPLAAVDGTGFSRSGPSQYFLKRIDGKRPVRRHVQVITMVDVERRKFISGTFFAKQHGEPQRVPTLHKQSPVEPDVLLMDKGFDAEWLHQWLNDNGTFSIAPVRKDFRKGRYRKIMRDCMDWCLYW